jgi:hypothetical protein
LPFSFHIRQRLNLGEELIDCHTANNGIGVSLTTLKSSRRRLTDLASSALLRAFNFKAKFAHPETP